MRWMGESDTEDAHKKLVMTHPSDVWNIFKCIFVIEETYMCPHV